MTGAGEKREENGRITGGATVPPATLSTQKKALGKQWHHAKART